MTWGKALIVLGLVLVGAGLILVGLERAGLKPFAWFGRLPGDIRIERGGARFYFPLVTCLLISAVISLVLWLLRR